MNSCLYDVTIMHDRQIPQRYRFTHHIFMFYLDLDEIDAVSKTSWLFGHNQSRVYNFRDDDHIVTMSGDIKTNILAYLKTKGVAQCIAKIKLLTNLRTFGYIFNPVSFYFCFDEKGAPVCVVPQIGNTFGELKYFFLGPQKRVESVFNDRQVKYYYISPFTDLEDVLDFNIQVPDEELNIAIDVVRAGKKYFYTLMSGPRLELSTANLIRSTLRYPLVTLKVIFLIHWHAAMLHFVKRIKHHAKEEHPHLQQEVHREWKKS